ncbi:MAG: hypothetical protein ACM3ZQ_01090 [Bacillota bacterium]
MAARDPDVLECLKENWQHARHVENERLSFTQFYAAIAGAVVTMLSQWFDKGRELVFALASFLLLLSILGLLLAHKWGQTFDKHMERGRKAAEWLGVTEYMVFPGQAHQYTGLGRILRTKHLFCYFYAAVIGVATGVMVYSLTGLTEISGAVALFIAVFVSVLTSREPKKDGQPHLASSPKRLGHKI